jgi:hypothetical protein
VAEVHDEDGWHARVMADARQWLDDKIGGGILADMKAGCPVDTSRLLNSLDKGMTDDTTLRVGSKDVDYSVYVVEGHRVAHRGKDGNTVYTGAVVPAQDFMRPALYRQRGA